ncbi:sulfotransferase domain-containing protein [Halomicroarcula limicola]|uniref:Sulfotransferase domain-containing protein n=1 Tax=Haloarcula limicola TaxID=1429915 RepID=A0A8J7Y7I3_9EURY|nr:sulfotransferase domain-containing protein [Halomicroarcula limicola]MBV0923118.1 sulfotransferase domain-containing protein [Halomicroarcula limicola]
MLSDTDEWVPDFVIVGPQKCATTWMYEGLAEHPEVYVPDTDSVHYFDMGYHRGTEWYRQHFPADPDEYAVIGEETPSYIRSEVTPERIAELNPDAKLLFSLRNPVDRAFSHYWHEKSKGKISFEFEELFENYDLYENWIRPGMYVDHIERFEEHFDSDQLKLLYFDDLVADDESFIESVYDFVGADPTFRPSILDERVNDARRSFGINAVDKAYYRAVNFVYRNFGESIKRPIRPLHEFVQSGDLSNPFQSESEYEKGMNPETRRRLEEIYLPKTKDLDERVDKTFEHWFEHVDY